MQWIARAWWVGAFAVMVLVTVETASAATRVTGVVRDTSQAVVADVRVQALRGGRVVAATVTDGDGRERAALRLDDGSEHATPTGAAKRATCWPEKPATPPHAPKSSSR